MNKFLLQHLSGIKEKGYRAMKKEEEKIMMYLERISMTPELETNIGERKEYLEELRKAIKEIETGNG